MILKAKISTVRDGFSYDRGDIESPDWPEFSRRLEDIVRQLSSENPDSILIKMERPQ